MRRATRAVVLLSLLAVAPLAAQQTDLAPRRSSGSFTWRHALMSLAVPGAGQIAAGEERGALYLVAEVFLLTRAISERNDGLRERDRYRQLALNVARRTFGGVMTDTTFEYYDKLGKFIESGPFDAIPGGVLDPPADTVTFNGSIWALARRTFLRDPDGPLDPDSEEYQRAIAFYRRRAIGNNFRWSWRNAGLEQDLFRGSIRASDDAFRRATNQFGALMVNHLLSAADAFISYRLGLGEGAVRSRIVPGNGSRGTDYSVNVTVSF